MTKEMFINVSDESHDNLDFQAAGDLMSIEKGETFLVLTLHEAKAALQFLMRALPDAQPVPPSHEPGACQHTRRVVTSRDGKFSSAKCEDCGVALTWEQISSVPGHAVKSGVGDAP